MPVIDPIIVTILPDNGQGIGSHSDNVADPCGERISKLDIEHIRVRFRLHVLMSAAAGGTWTGRAQQLKRIDARVIVAPCDCEFSGLFICGNASRFFVHIQLSPLSFKETGPWGGQFGAQEHTSGNPLQPNPRVFHHKVQRDTTTRSHPLRAAHPER